MAASMISAAERPPACQALPPCKLSTSARIVLVSSLLGAALTTITDSALSPSSFHHSGLATTLFSVWHCRSISKADAVATAQYSELTGARSLASRNLWTASTLCPELDSTAARLKCGEASSGLKAMSSRKAWAALDQSFLETHRAASASSS
eukprot:scaffold38150_cov65-Phaeocystis_antarctica.AAC.1